MKVQTNKSKIFFSNTQSNTLLVKWYAGLDEGLAIVKIRSKTLKNLQNGLFMATACSSLIDNMSGIIFSVKRRFDVILLPSIVSSNLNLITDNLEFIEEYNEGVRTFWYIKKVTNQKHISSLPTEVEYIVLKNSYIYFEAFIYESNRFIKQNRVITAKINFEDIGLK
jgi:hypothetical protein